MATCPSQKTMSPASSSLIGFTLHIALSDVLERGIFSPAAAYAYWTSPEQSYASGPLAPHTYVVFPTFDKAAMRIFFLCSSVTELPCIVVAAGFFGYIPPLE